MAAESEFITHAQKTELHPVTVLCTTREPARQFPGPIVLYHRFMFDDQRNRLLAALDEAHDAYYRAAVFAGPSLYFHLRTLEAAGTQDFERFTEYLYAVLASWGMHRMDGALRSGSRAGIVRKQGEIAIRQPQVIYHHCSLTDRLVVTNI
jgi:hypothetical protein